MLNKYSIFAALLWLCSVCQEGSAFTVPQHHSGAITTKKSLAPLSAHHDPAQNDSPSPLSSRREWTRKAFSALIATTGTAAILGTCSIATNPQPAYAAESGDTIWKTGKAPIVPGQAPKDKSDTKGTRKDPSFLRSISDCKSKCEQTPGPDGLARSSVDCLSACQDICCTTYEQCTFNIVPR